MVRPRPNNKGRIAFNANKVMKIGIGFFAHLILTSAHQAPQGRPAQACGALGACRAFPGKWGTARRAGAWWWSCQVRRRESTASVNVADDEMLPASTARLLHAVAVCATVCGSSFIRHHALGAQILGQPVPEQFAKQVHCTRSKYTALARSVMYSPRFGPRPS
jgi:hypothetical protein